jgi:hypothetical protein
MPHYMFSPRQQIISRTFKIKGTLVFLCPKERERARGQEREGEQEQEREQERGRERERERERERDRERGRERERDRESERERQKESTKALVILFLNRLGQTEKSTNYTVLYGKSGIVYS